MSAIPPPKGQHMDIYKNIKPTLMLTISYREAEIIKVALARMAILSDEPASVRAQADAMANAIATQR